MLAELEIRRQYVALAIALNVDWLSQYPSLRLGHCERKRNLACQRKAASRLANVR